MTFTTKDKTLFQLPALDRAQIKAAYPLALVTELFQANGEIAWKRFSPNNLKEIMCHIAKQHGLLLSEAPIAKPFGSFGGPISQRARRISNEWDFLKNLLGSPLPAVPSSKLISTNPAERLTFTFRGYEYKLPRLSTPRLFSKGKRPVLDIHIFVKTLLSDNQGSQEVVTNDVVIEALKEFAVHGFPGTSRELNRNFHELYSHYGCFIELDPRKQLPDSGHPDGRVSKSANGIVEVFNLNAGPSSVGAKYQSSRNLFLIRYRVEAQKDVYVCTNSSPNLRQSPKFLEHYRTALESENCAISVTLTKGRKQEVDAMQLFKHVHEMGTKGLSYGVRCGGQNTFLLVYEDPNRRDEALRTLSGSELSSHMKVVQKIGSRTSRRYVTWMFKLSSYTGVGRLIDALNLYFAGTGYSSRCVISWTGDEDLSYFITFEHAPPYLGDILARPDRSTLAVFHSKQSSSIAPRKSIKEQAPDASDTTSTGPGEDSDASDQEECSESQDANDEQEHESPSEASDEQEDQRSSSDATDNHEDLESSSEDEGDHDNGIQAPAISRISSNAAAIDASKSVTQQATTSQIHRALPSKKQTPHVEEEEEEEVHEDPEPEFASSHSSASSSEQSESQTDSSSSSEKSGQYPRHAQDGVTTIIGTKRKRTNSPSASSSHSSTNIHSTTVSQPAPLATPPTIHSLPKPPNAPTHLNPPNSISQPKDPKQPSYPIRSASKIARLATKDEEEEDPLALLERHVEEYALRLKRESTS